MTSVTVETPRPKVICFIEVDREEAPPEFENRLQLHSNIYFVPNHISYSKIEWIEQQRAAKSKSTMYKDMVGHDERTYPIWILRHCDDGFSRSSGWRTVLMDVLGGSPLARFNPKEIWFYGGSREGLQKTLSRLNVNDVDEWIYSGYHR